MCFFGGPKIGVEQAVLYRAFWQQHLLICRCGERPPSSAHTYTHRKRPMMIFQKIPTINNLCQRFTTL